MLHRKKIIALLFITLLLVLILKIIVLSKDAHTAYQYAINFNPIKNRNSDIGSTGFNCKDLEDIEMPKSTYLFHIFDNSDEKYIKSISLVMIKIANCQITNTDGATYPISNHINPSFFMSSFRQDIYQNSCGEQIRPSCVFDKILNTKYLENDFYINKEFVSICKNLKRRKIENHTQKCSIVMEK